MCARGAVAALYAPKSYRGETDGGKACGAEPAVLATDPLQARVWQRVPRSSDSPWGGGASALRVHGFAEIAAQLT